MPAPEETTGGPVTPEASSPEEQEQVEAGPVGSSRRRRRLVGGAVLVAVLVVALRGVGVGGGGGSGDNDDERGPSRSTTTATTAPAQGSPSSGVTVEPGPSTTVAPPDVARPRPPVDLAAPPPAGDAVEVARWWASVFVAYEGAEPMPDLVARLAAFTTPRLQAELQTVPPAASYDLPLEVAGASAQPAPAAAGGPRVQVTVETAGALVIYELALVPGPGGGWQVDQANRRV